VALHSNGFADLSVHLNELNVKVQRFGKPTDIMFSIITALEKNSKYIMR